MNEPSLDHKRNNRNRPCSGRSIRSVQVASNGVKEFVYKRLFCKKWNCPRCGPIKAWQACKDIPAIIEEKGLDRFLTLTLDPKNIPENEDRHKYIWKVWAKFRTYLKRKLKEKISYVCVLELHKSGLPHLHILVNRFIPQAWISNAWNAVGGGKIVFIEKIKEGKHIAHYLSKYLTKCVDTVLPKRLRRISTSRDIKLNKFDKGDIEWKPSPLTMEMIEKESDGKNAYKKHDNNDILTEIRADSSIDQPEWLDYSVWDVLRSLIAKGGKKKHESSHIPESVEQGTKRTRLLYRSSEEIAEFVRPEFRDSYNERVRRSRDRKEGRTDSIQPVGLFFEKEQEDKECSSGENRQAI